MKKFKAFVKANWKHWLTLGITWFLSKLNKKK